MNITLIVAVIVLFALINHLKGGFSLFRNAKEGEKHWFFGRPVYAYSFAFIVVLLANTAKTSLGWPQLINSIILTLFYVGYRQRSPNHIFFAGTGRNYPFDKNKPSGNPEANYVMQTVFKMKPEETAFRPTDWLVRYGKIYGAVWGFLGLAPAAVFFAITKDAWFLTIALLGLPVGLYHYYLGIGSKLGEKGMRGRSELAEGGLVIAPLVLLGLV